MNNVCFDHEGRDYCRRCWVRTLHVGQRVTFLGVPDGTEAIAAKVLWVTPGDMVRIAYEGFTRLVGHTSLRPPALTDG